MSLKPSSPNPRSAHRARKRFGQHFLHDAAVIARIIDAIDPSADERHLEIGPGLGALTLPLLQRIGHLEVIEIDRDVIPLLQSSAKPLGDLIVHEANALKVDLLALHAGAAPFRVCGNLPYNISTPLLFHFLAARSVITDMHFMLQREVVARMAALPDTADYGRLTVMLAAHCTVEWLFDVGPGSFRPAPRVHSSIVRLVPHSEPPFAVPDPARFAAVVAAAFSQRRKTLRNSVAGLISPAAFEITGIDPKRRAETLSPSEFADLSATPSPLYFDPNALETV